MDDYCTMVDRMRKEEFDDPEQRLRAAMAIVSVFCESVEEDWYPPENIERVFGIVMPLSEHRHTLVNCPMGRLVMTAWKELFRDAGLRKLSIVVAIKWQTLPDSFRRWVTCSADGNAYCQELVRRSEWDAIEWDFERLALLSFGAITKADRVISRSVRQEMSSSARFWDQSQMPTNFGQAVGALFDTGVPGARPFPNAEYFKDYSRILKSFVLMGGHMFQPLRDDVKMLLTHVAVYLFVDALGKKRYPDENVRAVFGVKKPPPNHTRNVSQHSIGALVFNAWFALLTNYRNNCNENTILTAVLSETLPASFQMWVELASNSDSACQELVKRGAWLNIPWDHEMLGALRNPSLPIKGCPDGVLCVDAEDETRNRKVVWMKIQKAEVHNRALSALEGGCLVEKPGSPRLLREFFLKSKWIPHKCEFLESLGEDIILYAEAADRGYSSRSCRSGRNNISATWLTQKADFVPNAVTIYGKALLVRRGGTDLCRDTVERLLHFLDQLHHMHTQLSEAEDETGLTRATALAMSLWPQFRVGDEIMHDERLKPANVNALAGRTVVPTAFVPADELVEASSVASFQESTCSESTKIILLEFSRDPAAFHHLLQEGIHNDALIKNLCMDDLVECKRALESSGLEYRLASGAYIFVPVRAHAAVKAHISCEGMDLSSTHVFVTVELEASVMSAVLALPRKHKISLQKRSDIMETVEEHPPSLPTGEGEPLFPVLVKRTFIHVVVPSSLRAEVSSGPRTVSSTDADERKGENPRASVARRVINSN